MRHSIIIADQDVVLIELLRSRCEILGMHVEIATRADDAARMIQQSQPDLICIDRRMTCGDGRNLCDVLARDPGTSRIPAIVLTERPDQPGPAAYRELCAYVIPRSGNLWHRMEPLIYELIDLAAPMPDTASAPSPVSSRHRGPRLSSHRHAPAISQEVPMRHVDPPAANTNTTERDARESVLDAVFAWFGEGEPSEAEPQESASLHGPHKPRDADLPWVLCIEDDYDFSMALKLRLEAHGVAVVRAFDGTTGYRAAFTHPASAILLDYNLPQGQGDYVLRRLKETPITRDVPVIVVTGNRSTAIKRQMMNMGADGYLTKPLDFAELVDLLGRHIDLLPLERVSSTAGTLA